MIEVCPGCEGEFNTLSDTAYQPTPTSRIWCSSECHASMNKEYRDLTHVIAEALEANHPLEHAIGESERAVIHSAIREFYNG